MAGQFKDKERMIARCITHVHDIVDAVQAVCDQTALDEIEGLLFPPPTDPEKAQMLVEIIHALKRAGEDDASDAIQAVEARVAALTVIKTIETEEPKEIKHEVEETERPPGPQGQ